MAFPESYWERARYGYYRDHDNGGWGVRDGWDSFIKGPLSQNEAAAIALILNGDGHLARDMLPQKRSDG
jgi:hypothetical protein